MKQSNYQGFVKAGNWAPRAHCLSGAWLLAAVLAALATLPAHGSHKVQVSSPEDRAIIEASGGQLIADYTGYQLYSLPDAPFALLNRPVGELRDEYNLIHLNAATLDTTQPQAQAMRPKVGPFSGKRLHLVQFAGPVMPAWRQELVAACAQIVAYVPENTYLLYADATALTAVQARAVDSPHLQWDGAFLDSYKIHPDARTTDEAGNSRALPTDQFAIQMVADPAENPVTLKLIEQQKLAPILSKSTVLDFLNVVVRLSPEALAMISARPEVISIQLDITPQKFCERQAQIVAGNLIAGQPAGPGYLAWLTGKGFAQAQFTTSGFVVDVTDSGVDNGTTSPNHTGLRTQGSASNAGRVAYNRLEGTPNAGSTLKGCDGHGTLNAHVAVGYDDLAAAPHTDPSGYHYGLGICPWVKVGSSVIFDPDSFTRPDYTDLQSRAYRDGARVSNNSWGANVSGSYTISSQEYDALARDAQPAGAAVTTPGNQETTLVMAAGNAGPNSGSVGAPGTAKNVITVGAAENVQAIGGTDACGTADGEANNASDIVSFSSRGPCRDGRQKPELVAPGSHVSGGLIQAANPPANGQADSCFTALGVCGGNNNPFFPAGQQLFTVSTGTSLSAPAVAGGCALVRQWFINNFTTPSSPAMVKAFLVNSARYMTGSGANDTLWSRNQGMGEMNLGLAFDGVSRVFKDQRTNDLFTASGGVRTFTGRVATNNRPFRVTLAWTDAPGSTTGNAYNNNLDLTVTVGGNTYKDNVFTGSNSVTGGTADLKNNLESVFLPAGVSGDYTVTVTATSINSDGVPNNATATDQDFALVIYNASEVTAPAISAINPASLTVLQGQPAAFTLTLTGSTPLSYQWRKDGTNLPGATASTFAIASAVPDQSGTYSAIVTNLNGAATSGPAILAVVPTVPLNFALNNSNLTWVTDTSTPWYGQTNTSEDGVAAARAYFVTNGQQSGLRSTVTGPGTVSFWWKIAAGSPSNTLAFSYGTSQGLQIAGDVDWEPQTVYLPADSSTLQWLYSKRAPGPQGSEGGYVDLVTFSNGATVPFIVKQPLDASSVAGSPVTFTVEARGTPPLNYQWRLNGGDVAGATRSSITINSPTAAETGLYSVQVTSTHGSAVSSNAFLGAVPMAIAGDNTYGQAQVAAGATNPITIAAGAWHALALDVSGKVVAWGANFNGQCDVPAWLPRVTAIAGGGYHSLAATAQGSVAAWGDNSAGQTNVPGDLSNVIAVAAGTWHSLALRSDGTVVGWGDNSAGQTAPQPGLSNVVVIAAGGNHSLALQSDGQVVAWGENTDALGFYAGQSDVPWALGSAVGIAAGDYHSLALLTDGTVATWGDDSQGQCSVPPGLQNVLALAAGNAHSVAVRLDGTGIAWGANNSGQLATTGISNAVAAAAGSSVTYLLLGTQPPMPKLTSPRWIAGTFSAWIASQPGRLYRLEYKTPATATNWLPLSLVPGNGASQVLTDPGALPGERYYRARRY